ncbi:MAG: GTP-binding protein [Methanobacteriota archaeon]|nr:MAG: GTP-binding protein [Euryarchaeota archaeon]
MNVPGEERYIFKLVLTGNERVGKTTLRKRFMGIGFAGEYKKTIGVDLSYMKFRKGNEEHDLVIWDIAGDANFQKNRAMYYRGTNGAFLVLDVTTDGDLQTYVQPWIDDFNRQGIIKHMQLAIIFNKIDLEGERKLFEKEKQQIIDYVKENIDNKEIEIGSFETSALTGDGVKEAFEWLIEKMLETHG